MARTHVETLKHSQAFDFYLSLGSERNYTRVAEKFQVSHTSIANWSQSFGWHERVIEAEKKLAQIASKQTVDSLAEFDRKLVNIADAVINLFIKRVKNATDEEGNLKPNGYKPSSLDAKIWGELKRTIMAKGEGSLDLGQSIDSEVVESLGSEQIERIIIERITRLSGSRKKDTP